MTYYSDGFVIGQNPSKVGGGFTVVSERNEVIKRQKIGRWGYTNNDGEIDGIKFAVEYCAPGDTIITDSMVALSWIRFGRSKARPDLTGMLMQLKDLIETKGVKVEWKSRDVNFAGQLNERTPIRSL